MTKVEKGVVFWFPPLFWMGFIYFLSSFHKLQASPIGWQDFLVRKTAHFLEYFILFLLFYRAFKNTTKNSSLRISLLSLIITFLYSITDEYHQTFINGRSGKIFDVGVDFLGGLFGVYFINELISRFPKRTKKFFKKIDIL